MDRLLLHHHERDRPSTNARALPTLAEVGEVKLWFNDRAWHLSHWSCGASDSAVEWSMVLPIFVNPKRCTVLVTISGSFRPTWGYKSQL